MLFRRLFFASSPKLYFMKTLTCKWLGMVRYGWLSVSPLSCGPENTPSVGNPLPPSPKCGKVWKWWSDNLTVSLVYLAAWVKVYPRVPILSFRIINNYSEKQPSGWLVLLRIFSVFAVWISAYGHGASPFSSQITVTFSSPWRNITTCSNPGVRCLVFFKLPWLCQGFSWQNDKRIIIIWRKLSEQEPILTRIVLGVRICFRNQNPTIA